MRQASGALHRAGWHGFAVLPAQRRSLLSGNAPSVARGDRAHPPGLPWRLRRCGARFLLAETRGMSREFSAPGRQCFGGSALPWQPRKAECRRKNVPRVVRETPPAGKGPALRSAAGCSPAVPFVGVQQVAVQEGPCDLLVADGDLLLVDELLLGAILDVVHIGTHRSDLAVL